MLQKPEAWCELLVALCVVVEIVDSERKVADFLSVLSALGPGSAVDPRGARRRTNRHAASTEKHPGVSLPARYRLALCRRESRLQDVIHGLRLQRRHGIDVEVIDAGISAQIHI